MGWEHRGPLQEGPESALLPGFQRLQQDAADVLLVCGGQRYLLCCPVLGPECECERHPQAS